RRTPCYSTNGIGPEYVLIRTQAPGRQCGPLLPSANFSGRIERVWLLPNVGGCIVRHQEFQHSPCKLSLSRRRQTMRIAFIPSVVMALLALTTLTGQVRDSRTTSEPGITRRLVIDQRTVQVVRSTYQPGAVEPNGPTGSMSSSCL